MDTHEANQLMEESLRCLARMMEQIKLREIGKVVEIIKKHDMQTWKDGEYSMPIGYLETWMARNYWQ